MKTINTVETFGFQVFSDELDKIQLNDEKAKTLNTISPNSYGISTKDSDFRKALIESDFLVLDGVYFALASILKNGKNIKENNGPNVFKFFMKKLNENDGRVFFLGSSLDTLIKIEKRLKSEYPNITAGFFSPPFKSFFNTNENLDMIEAINRFQPDIVFLGMTCPKQEKWAFEHKTKLKTKLICSVGAVFDWYAGTQKDIHPIWWKLRLAWLKRTIDRPEILKRYPNIAIFFLHLLKNLISNK